MDASLAIFLSFFAHVGALAALAVAPPSLDEAAPEAVPAEHRHLVTACTAMMEAIPELGLAPETPAGVALGRSEGPADSAALHMGELAASETDRRFGVEGSAPVPQLAAVEGLRRGRECCVSHGPTKDDVHRGNEGPVTPWGRDVALGGDEATARGRARQGPIGQALGAEGLEGDGEGSNAGRRGLGGGVSELASSGGYRCRMP